MIDNTTPIILQTFKTIKYIKLIYIFVSMFLYIPALWTLWIMFLSSVQPWGIYFLLILVALTLFAPVWFFIRSAQFAGDMARLTPAYDRPKGH